MITKKYTQTEFLGLFIGTASINIVDVTEITFENLSEKGKIKALELGFSPAISLPCPPDVDNVENPNLRDFLENLANSDYWLVIQSETAQPITAILWKESFFDYRKTLK